MREGGSEGEELIDFTQDHGYQVKLISGFRRPVYRTRALLRTFRI